MGQQLVVPGEVDANLARATEMITAAAGRRCDVVVLPETLDVGWTHGRAVELARPVPGPTTDTLCRAAAAHGIVVAAGVTERAGGLVHNTAVLIDAAGEIVLRHRKINELDFAREVYATGSSLAVADTAIGRVGLDVCADNSASSVALGHALGLMGARILLSPSAWAVPPGHDNVRDPYGEEWVVPYRELAVRHGMPVVGVSNVGPVVGGTWDGWSCIGASLVVDRDGEVVAQAPYGVDAETLLTVDLAVG
ncbi:carbon-nitrogen hydrolase family protein [Motilibacter deserti]|nr:carbon-nitrogen hydrolase family protein [Motilibacter deserti]